MPPFPMAAPKLSLPQVLCAGTPYEIGFAHGTQLRTQVHRTIFFYTSLFQETTRKTWPEVLSIASTFLPFIKTNLPSLLDEMEGLADGAQTTLLDIVAINVRTEINFGLFSDGCTALGWRTEDGTLLAQNWDWMEAQKENLVLMTVRKEGCPAIKMVTEAGLIGKIGMNERGVGVCLNAIRAKGMSTERVPCHLALRLVLESSSLKDAVERLEAWGVASACHMLVADEKGAVGLEWSADTGKRLEMNRNGQVFHSNHYLHDDLKGTDTSWLEDSGFRVTRIEELCGKITSPDLASVQALFKDEANYPGAICRKQQGDCHSATLFNIVMDLKARRARVILGRPVEPDEEVDIIF
ncbi:Meiotically up-regulated protein 70 protein [Sphaceloma murrayae]|uniref:Meiotically up-regulated protein 70 protein n=1 Tax=Sphaceloma murrayae TaxID=2082308 RepID=A0A2K1QGV7_9PEZI|nr:Meiotically up-regulated protein 70 protein [Sphaceloma murrayae]